MPAAVAVAEAAVDAAVAAVLAEKGRPLGEAAAVVAVVEGGCGRQEDSKPPA
jgi:hypothetical protein